MSILAPVYNYMFKRMTSRLARMGLTYHDAIADTGIYDQAISRLPPHMQVRGGRRGGRGCGGRGGARQGCSGMQGTLPLAQCGGGPASRGGVLGTRAWPAACRLTRLRTNHL